MSYGVFQSEDHPGDYFQSYDRSKKKPFSADSFLMEDYFDKTAVRGLKEQFEIGDESIQALSKLFGVVLRHIQASSMMPVEVVKEAVSLMDAKDLRLDSDYKTTLSPEKIAEAIRYCVDEVILNISPLLDGQIGDQSCAAIRSIGKRKETEFTAPQDNIASRLVNNVSQVTFQDDDLLSPEAKEFVNGLEPKYQEAIIRLLTGFAKAVYSRSLLSTPSFTRDVGGKPEAIYASQRDGILPGDATFYSTLNPTDLIECVRGMVGFPVLPLILAKIGF